MGMSLEQLLGQNLSELISSDLFSADLSSRLSAASGAGASLSRLESNEIAFSAGSFNFSILGSNFSADLLQVVSLLNSGSSVEQALIDQISGQVSSIVLSDTQSGLSVSLNLTNSDGNIQNAETSPQT